MVTGRNKKNNENFPECAACPFLFASSFDDLIETANPSISYIPNLTYWIVPSLVLNKYKIASGCSYQ